VDVASQGLYQIPPIKVLCGNPHSSIYKALSMLGMGRENVVEVSCLPNTEACGISALESQLQKLGGEYCIVVANAGTVNATSFDDFTAINELKTKYGFWLHVDAAFGLFAACSPKFKHLVEGIDFADSITVDAHKWLNVPYDSAVQFTKHKTLQNSIFQNSNAAYLGDHGDMVDYMNHTPETSRRLRALTVWFTLMAYGKEGYREIVERNCAVAKLLAEKIQTSKYFELLSPTNLNVVCFTLAKDMGTASSVDVRGFLTRLTKDGKVFMTPTTYNGKHGIRAALCNWRTTERDIQIAWDAMEQCASINE
jgi:glutamate/tyrosine decarboxylase-like PLP-dependent enzyme